MASNLVTNLQNIPAAVESISKMGQYEPFDLQVARNQIMGHRQVNIFGYNSAQTTAQQAVWENAGTAYVFPTVAQVMNLSSSNAADTASILIQGLDANRNEISETLVLNGTTVVPTVNQFFRVNVISVTAGSATNPAGVVTLKNSAGTPNTITYAQIATGAGKSQMSVYSVPNGYTLYLSRIDAFSSFNGNNASYINYRNVNTLPSGVVQSVAQSAFGPNYRIQRVMPLPMGINADIQFQLGTSASTAAVGIFVECFLIQNDGQALPSAI
jgi:hypothetical protein